MNYKPKHRDILQVVSNGLNLFAREGMKPPATAATPYLQACWLLSLFQGTSIRAQVIGRQLDDTTLTDIIMILKNDLPYLRDHHNQKGAQPMRN